MVEEKIKVYNFFKGTLSNGTFSMTSIRFREKYDVNQVPLSDPEGSNFIRGGIIDGKTTTPEERKKSSRDVKNIFTIYH